MTITKAHQGWTVAAILLVVLGQAEGATLFVSPDGDGSDGLAWETAFNKVGDAIVASSTNDAIWIKAATYTENILASSYIRGVINSGNPPQQ